MTKNNADPLCQNQLADCQLATGGAGAAEPIPWLTLRKMRATRHFLLKHPNRLYWKLHGLFFRTSKGVLKVVWPSCPVLRSESMAAEVENPNGLQETQQLCEPADLQVGDLVRVRSHEEIRGTLDSRGCCRGCYFMKPMARYCGQEFRVIRRVEHFFDEVRGRMLRCKNIVFLDGVQCDGTGNPKTMGCDRACFVFWRTEWLEKLDA